MESGEQSLQSGISKLPSGIADPFAKLALTKSGQVALHDDEPAQSAEAAVEAGNEPNSSSVESSKPAINNHGKAEELVPIDKSGDSRKPMPRPNKERRRPSRDRGDQALRPSTIVRYTLVGELVNCNGLVATMRKGSEEGIVHIQTHAMHSIKSFDGLDGSRCAFAVGGSPVRYAQNKPYWESSVVEWCLLDEIEYGLSEDAFYVMRGNLLASANRQNLLHVLEAKWYKEEWIRVREKPKAKLQNDEKLDYAVATALAGSSNIEELLLLLGAVLNSPYYALTAAEQLKTIRQFFLPAEWNLRVFIPNRRPEECKYYAEVWPHCGSEIEPYVNKAGIVAIDLETSGELIWEYGWRNAQGAGVKRERPTIPESELNRAVAKSLLSLPAPCIVGHNILKWDLPILKKRGVGLPDGAEYWDTLLASWLLEPWIPLHALVAGENAHSADVDASRAYELFEAQAKRLAACFTSDCRDLPTLVRDLCSGALALSKCQDRHYPADLSKKLSASSLYPRNRINDVNWQQYCHIQYTTPQAYAQDPILDPVVCKRLASDVEDIRAHVLAAVVVDAADNNVEVRLSMLPVWLIDGGIGQQLQEEHAYSSVTKNDGIWRNIYIADDLFLNPLHESMETLRGFTVPASCAGEVMRGWQVAYSRSLSFVQVEEEYPGISDHQRGRTLLPVRGKAGDPMWLLYEPPGINDDASSWNLLPPIPAELGRRLGATGESGLDRWARIPRWRDGRIKSLDTDRLFVSSDTDNRRLYLSDIVLSLINIQSALLPNEILIFAMQRSSEAGEVQKYLTQLSSSILHSDSPVRQIERAKREGHRLIVCKINDVHRYVRAAKHLRQEIRVAVEELPLYEWYALLHAPEIIEPAAKEETLDAVLLDPAGENDNDSDVEPVEDRRGISRVVLKGQDIVELISLFLADWLGTFLRLESPPQNPVLVLDARIFDNPSCRKAGISQESLPFFPIEECLDKKRQEVYYEVCFPQRSSDDIPNDYNSYREFLQANWGYKDFIEGTQKPAIEAFVASSKDMLLRLPTGAGKSEVFQVPALFRGQLSGRLSVVISPLRALMRDQVERLHRCLFIQSVDYLSGGRDNMVNYDVYQGILDGRIKLVYVAPERFRVKRFTEALERRRRMDGGLELIIFDEAHCVSEWGFEFRPDYLHAAQFVSEWFRSKKLPGNPHRIMMLSATVTKRNQKDLEKELKLSADLGYDDLPKDMPHPIQPFIKLESFDLFDSEDINTDEKLDKIFEIVSELNLAISAAIIFVSRRKDCHRISEALNVYATEQAGNMAQLHALPFHAGLPEGAKTETIELLKLKAVNVLVCTKAFGMGMDIRHFHSCIHYRPPTFIEDYLQEVGRIGRGGDERQVAMKDEKGQVTATLLFNHDNLEQNIGRLQENAIKPPDLRDFFEYCRSNAIEFKEAGKSVCIIPSVIINYSGKNFDDNQVVSCLFWLQRMEVLYVEGRYPPSINLTLRVNTLRKLSNADTAAASVARAILELVDETNQAFVSNISEKENLPFAANEDLAFCKPKTTTNESVFGRFVRGLVNGIFALMSPPKYPPVIAGPEGDVANKRPSATAAGVQDDLKVCMAISEIMSTSGTPSTDELYAQLLTLHNAKGLILYNELYFRCSEVPNDTKTYWKLLEHVVKSLLRPTGGRVEYLDKVAFQSQIMKWYEKLLMSPSVPEENDNAREQVHKGSFDKQIKREGYRAIHTATMLLRYSGMEIKDHISSKGSSQYVRVIPDASIASVKQGVDQRIRAMKTLIDELDRKKTLAGAGSSIPFAVELIDVMKLFGSELRYSQLKDLINLVEKSGFYGVENIEQQWSSIVTLNRKEALPHYRQDAQDIPELEPEEDDQNIHEKYSEMLQKHEMQVLRAQSMILFAAIPSETRKQFIDDYFDCLTAKELQTLLEDNVGNVSDEVFNNNPMLSSLRDDVRRERYAKELDELKPNQRDVCTALYSEKMLVNAGPGSGKTHVLMMRCAHLIHAQHINPSEILVLAFNRAVVFEIRDRIRDLFRSLGYGNTVRRLDVSTFHSFALREQTNVDLFEDDAIGAAVHCFAESLCCDEAFAKRVAGKYKAILIDEYQDMNEDFYKVVTTLGRLCQGGIMVIGDDDQDILAWNRKQWHRRYHLECPIEAISYFNDYVEIFKPQQYTLDLNFRSATEIVSHNCEWIATARATIDFMRMKEDVDQKVWREDKGYVDLSLNVDLLEKIADSLVAGNGKSNEYGTVAMLCRSNKGCWKAFNWLVGRGIHPDQVHVLGSEDFSLYQIRPTGTIMDMCYQRDEWEFVEPDTWDDMLNVYQQLHHADVEEGSEYLKMLYELIRMEHGRPRIKNVIDFIKDTKVSDLERLKSKTTIGQTSKIIISTIHKVKGLQFDTVVVIPSSDKFPMNNDADDVQVSLEDAAEEARLYYVAMTRARNRLYMKWPDQERAGKWLSRLAYAGRDTTNSFLLKGSPKELFVSWAGQIQQYDNGVQDYIEKNVNVRDSLSIKGNQVIFHNNTRVGILSNKMKDAIVAAAGPVSLRVSNVIRYTAGSYMEEHHPDFYAQLHPAVKRRHWFYIVLPES